MPNKKSFWKQKKSRDLKRGKKSRRRSQKKQSNTRSSLSSSIRSRSSSMSTIASNDDYSPPIATADGFVFYIRHFSL